MVTKAQMKHRPLLYTDTIEGKQVCRDDMWVLTTEELDQLSTELTKNQEEVKELKDECAGMSYMLSGQIDPKYPDLLSRAKLYQKKAEVAEATVKELARKGEDLCNALGPEMLLRKQAEAEVKKLKEGNRL